MLVQLLSSPTYPSCVRCPNSPISGCGLGLEFENCFGVLSIDVRRLKEVKAAGVEGCHSQLLGSDDLAVNLEGISQFCGMLLHLIS